MVRPIAVRAYSPHALVSPAAQTAPAATTPPSRYKTVNLAHAEFELLNWAAENAEARAYIDEDLRDATRCKGALLMAALKAFGVRKVSDGVYERSDAPQHNRFEQLRVELRGERENLERHFEARFQAAQAQFQAQQGVAAGVADELRQQLHAAHQQLTRCQQELQKALEVRSPAAARARDAEERARALAESNRELELRSQDAERRACKAEARADQLEADVAVHAAAAAGVASRGQQQQQLRQAEADLATCRERIAQLEGGRVATGRRIANLEAQLAAHERQEARAETMRRLEFELHELQKAKDAAYKEADRLYQENNELRRGGPVSRPAPASNGDDSGKGIVPLQSKAGAALSPQTAELTRRLVSEGKVAKQNIPIVVALCLSCEDDFSHSALVPLAIRGPF